MKITKWFTGLFKKKVLPPHICKYECSGYCDHYGQMTHLTRDISPTEFHYPERDVYTKWWIKMGYDAAQVFQSHWKCSCGKRQTFFFLANPYKRDPNRKRNDNITQDIYDAMISHNPFKNGSSRGTSMDEMVDELTKEFCR